MRRWNSTLRSRKPLRSNTPLKGKTRLKPISDKKRKQIAELDAITPELMARAGHRCEYVRHEKVTEFIPDRAPLERHHIDHNENNNEIENIAILCPACHDYWHAHNVRTKKQLRYCNRKEV